MKTLVITAAILLTGAVAMPGGYTGDNIILIVWPRQELKVSHIIMPVHLSMNYEL